MVCSGAAVLGAIELRDIVKADIKSRFAELRAMVVGIKQTNKATSTVKLMTEPE